MLGAVEQEKHESLALLSPDGAYKRKDAILGMFVHEGEVFVASLKFTFKWASWMLSGSPCPGADQGRR